MMLLLVACSGGGPVGRLDLRLISPDGQDPFAEVEQLVMSFEEVPSGSPGKPVVFAPSAVATLPPVPPGDGYVVRFDGLDRVGRIVATGSTPPLRLRAEGIEERGVLFGLVHRFANVAPAASGRVGLSLTLLEDGRALLLGGARGNPAAPTLQLETSVALYDPARVELRSTAGTFGRIEHSASLLSSGRVLVAGGRDANRAVLRDMALFTPDAQGAPAPLPTQLPEARAAHTATILPGDRVVFVGGIGSDGRPLASLRVYDAGANAFIREATLSSPRFGHSATLLSGGRILIAGGEDGSAVLDSAEIFSLDGGLSLVPSLMRSPRARHSATRVDGDRVLVVGGSDGFAALSSIEAYVDRPAPSFVPVTHRNGLPLAMLEGRADHVAALLSGQRVLVAGGGDPHRNPPLPSNGALWILIQDLPETPSALEAEIAGVPALERPRQSAAAAVLPDGNVLLAGGAMLVGSEHTAAPGVEIFVARPP